MDHGPIVAVQARVGELLFGESVFGIRVLSAVAGAATVFLTGMLGWAMGGRSPAQALAMFAVLLTPQYIGVDGFLSDELVRGRVLDAVRTGGVDAAARRLGAAVVDGVWGVGG